MTPVPLPGDFTLRFAGGLRRPRPGALIGGSPLRVLRLSDAGNSLVESWMAGRPVGPDRAAGTLAARLVDAGIADPVPPGTPGLAVAVVVPVRDDPAGLAATLDALRALSPKVPVVVVDDGSQPALHRAGHAGVDLQRRPVPAGPAAARNAGARAAPDGTEVIVFVDAGCVPAAGWLPRLLAHFSDPGLAAVAPRVISRAVPGTPSALGCYEAAHSPLDLGPAPSPVRPGAAVAYVPTAVLAVRAGAFRDVGGFDERMRFGEDVDLVWRLHAAGWRVRYEPAATATHPARTDRRRWLRQRFDYGRSATPLAARHGRAAAPLSVSPWSLAVWVLLVARRPAAALAVTAGTAEALARRAGPDRALAGELRRLAVRGHLRAGGPIASAVRRAWLPPALLAVGAAWPLTGRRTRLWLGGAAAAVMAAPGMADWCSRRPAAGPLAWAAWCLADDLAYQAGVWDGALRARSAAALLPRW